jgi:hypothetical protein
MRSPGRLTPQTTLEAVFGRDIVFSPKAAPVPGTHYLSGSDPQVRDFHTTGYLTITGELELICSRGGLSPGCLALYRQAGLPVAQRLRVYEDDAGYLGLLNDIATEGGTLAYQHRHPEALLPRSASWIDPDLVSWLNNKLALPEFVPDGLVPRREVIAPDAMTALRPSPTRPLVLKGATPYSSGSGGALAIVRSEAELCVARDRLAGCDAIILEEFLQLERTWCLNYCSDGLSVRFLGAGEQITDDQGRYHGNWFDDRMAIPDEVGEAGTEIMRRAMARGYRGFAGFDFGVTTDGRLVAMDLNFRLCGSTAPLLWWPALAERFGPHPTARGASFTSRLSPQETLSLVADACGAGFLLPLAAFDPHGTGWATGPMRVKALLMGRDRDEVEGRLRALVAAGLSS